MQVINSGNELITYLYIKPTGTHQYLHATSCHVYHSKTSIPYSQTLRLNRICSTSDFFDKRCNQLEAYTENRVRMLVLAARKFYRNYLLGKEKPEKKFSFNS